MNPGPDTSIVNPGAHSSAVRPALPRNHSWIILLGILIALSIPILFYGLGNYSLVNGDEGFYHGVARNMAETGNWFRLEFTGEHRVYDTFLNAPVQYWARGVLILLFGDNYWTMRLCSTICALLCVIALFRCALWIAGPRAAFLSGLTLLTMFQFVYLHSGRTGELEPMVCLALILAAYTFLRAVHDGRSFIPHFLCVMLVGNLKAPLVLLPLVAAVAYFATFSAHRSSIKRWFLTGLILPLGFVWHIAQYFLIGQESLEAFASMKDKLQTAKTPAMQAGGPLNNFIFYMKVLFFGTFPYSTAFPVAILYLFGRRKKGETAKVTLLAYFVLAIVIFYLIVTQHYGWYIIPTYPFLAALFGIWLDRVMREERGVLFSVAVPALLATLAAGLVMLKYNPFMVRSVFIPTDEIEWRELLSLSPAIGIPLLFVALIAFFFLMHRMFKVTPTSIGLFCMALVLFGFAAERVIYPLQFVDYTSKLEEQYRDITARMASGEELEFPIKIHETGQLAVRYFFGDDFEIAYVRQKRRGGLNHLVLVGEGQTSKKPETLRPSNQKRPPNKRKKK